MCSAKGSNRVELNRIERNLVIFISENCFRDKGQTYTGTLNVTQTGLACQAWSSQSPHTHSFYPDEYPGLEENYCRNPDLEARTWCFTRDQDTRWGYCDVTPCEKEGLFIEGQKKKLCLGLPDDPKFLCRSYNFFFQFDK